jgi:hypothetical protein
VRDEDGGEIRPGVGVSNFRQHRVWEVEVVGRNCGCLVVRKKLVMKKNHLVLLLSVKLRTRDRLREKLGVGLQELSADRKPLIGNCPYDRTGESLSVCNEWLFARAYRARTCSSIKKDKGEFLYFKM